VRKSRFEIHKNITVERDLFPNEPTTLITIIKSADEIVNNSAVLQDDDEFYFDVGSNETWEVEMVLRYMASAGADFDWDWSLPAGGTFDGVTSQLQTAAATVNDDTWRVADETGPGVGPGGLGTATPVALWIKGLIVTADTAGLAQFRWAQDTATASNATLLAGSFMVRRKVE